VPSFSDKVLGEKPVAFWQVVGGVCALLALLGSVIGFATTHADLAAIGLGGLAVCVGLPMCWVWSVRRQQSLRGQAMFALAVILTLAGGTLIGGGGVARSQGTLAGRAQADSASATGAQSTGANARPSASGSGGHTAGAVAPTGTAIRPASPGKETVRRQQHIVITTGHAIDLDDKEGNFGETSAGDRLDTDIALSVLSLSAQNEATLARIPEPNPGYRKCWEATGAGYVLSYTVRDPGTPTLCVHTNEHRAAALQITAVEKDSLGYMAQISAEVTVWELA
jgi:hypothetical protein